MYMTTTVRRLILTGVYYGRPRPPPDVIYPRMKAGPVTDPKWVQPPTAREKIKPVWQYIRINIRDSHNIIQYYSLSIARWRLIWCNQLKFTQSTFFLIPIQQKKILTYNTILSERILLYYLSIIHIIYTHVHAPFNLLYKCNWTNNAQNVR